MKGYRFELGDLVCLIGRMYGARIVPDAFEITALLPVRDDVPQYRIRSEYERHERVVLENDIELVNDRAANSNIPAHQRNG